MAQQNEIQIIGTLAEVQTRTGSSTNADGALREYVSGSIIVKVVIDGVENLIPCNVYAAKTTKAGAPSKTYPVLLGLEGMIGKRIRVSANFNEGAMLDEATGDVRHFNRVEASFINPASPTDVDKAEFDFTGFVTSVLTERRDREDNLIGYRINIAKASYDDSKAVVIRFDVSKDTPHIANGIETYYGVGSSVTIHGRLGCVTTIEQRTEAVAFGEPVVKQFARTDKTYTICSGDEPLTEDNVGFYSEERIQKLIAGYKDADERMKNAPKEQAAAPSAAAQAMASLSRKPLI